MRITLSRLPSEKLEALMKQGYIYKGGTKDEVLINLENEREGILYDVQRDLEIKRYRIERWERR